MPHHSAEARRGRGGVHSRVPRGLSKERRGRHVGYRGVVGQRVWPARGLVGLGFRELIGA